MSQNQSLPTLDAFIPEMAKKAENVGVAKVRLGPFGCSLWPFWPVRSSPWGPCS